MVPMSVKFVAERESGFWPDIPPKKMLDMGIMSKVAVLADGMQSGLPSVMFRIDMPDGTVIITQQTGAQIVLLGHLIEAKFPALKLE